MDCLIYHSQAQIPGIAKTTNNVDFITWLKKQEAVTNLCNSLLFLAYYNYLPFINCALQAAVVCSVPAGMAVVQGVSALFALAFAAPVQAAVAAGFVQAFVAVPAGASVPVVEVH